METRMEKYNSSKVNGNRTERNRELYKEVNKADLEVSRSYDNSKVIDETNNSIDIDKIKRYIEKMNENTTVIKRTKINDIETPNYEEKQVEEIKDYDLNSVLEKARSKREIDYGKERSKKVNIRYEELLQKLEEFNERHGIKEQEEDEILNTGERRIIDLFNTVKYNKEEADLFDDLKASENTQVLGNINDIDDDLGFKDEIKKQINNTGFTMTYTKIETSPLTEEDKKALLEGSIKLPEVEEEKQKDDDVIELTNSFYTTGDVFNKKDFESDDEDEDENWEDEKSSPLKTIGLIIAVIVLLAILVVVSNYVFKLGLF